MPRITVVLNMAHWLFLPDDAIKDLEILASLSAERLEALRNHFDTHEYSPRYTFYTKVAELLNISDEAAAELCGFISHVQTQRSRLERDAVSVPDELDYFLTQAAKKTELRDITKRLQEYIRAHKRQLVRLFSDFAKKDYSDKVRGLESGPLPHLHSFRTLCDLRPVYDEDAKKILAYLPVITLSMVVHTSVSDEYQEVSVMLTEGEVREIREALDRLDKKLVILKKQIPMRDPKAGEG